MQVSTLSLWGAGAFGAVIGWIAYRTLRRNTKATTLTDLVTVIMALGGGVVVNTKFADPDLFASYGIGLFAGFFGYFLVALLVDRAEGRRRKAAPPEPVASVAPEPVAPESVASESVASEPVVSVVPVGAGVPAPAPEPVGAPRETPDDWMGEG
ncbi:hypothetical protein [Kitasatospora sp. NPDC057198]|uniref:hypothetical protein n=1 Tax=Kitasatospora sp. NPDC057198 TaxID=3346046 RepID=UPI0036437EB3